jgi:hypothetical protein
MSKVKLGHEDVLIGRPYHWDNKIAVSDPILDKYHFHYNAR